MNGRALFFRLFAMASGIATFCLAVAFAAFAVFGNDVASRISFAFIIALVIFSAASLLARAYRGAARRAEKGPA